MHLGSCCIASQCISTVVHCIMIGIYGITIDYTCILKQSFHSFNSTALIGPRPIVLQMISRPYIRLAMDSLRNEPRLHQVLMMPGDGEVVPPEIEAFRRSGREFLKNCLIPSKEIDGKKPSKQQRAAYAKLMDIDVDANQIYSLSSQGHLFQLLEYG